MPDGWDTKLNELQRMIILRCLRPDRVMMAAKAFIVNNLVRDVELFRNVSHICFAVL